jgi:pimeloyl-ACP methyl ester carboxylesterase
MDLQVGRRDLLRLVALGGAVAGTGALAACAKADSSGASASASALPTSTISTSEVAPLQLFASSDFNDEALFALGGASSQVSEVGEMMRIAQTINSRTGNPAEPGTDAFDAYFDVFGEWGNNLQSLADQAGAAHPITRSNRLMRAATYSTQQLFFVLGTSNGSREEQAYQVTQDRWSKAIETFTPAVRRGQVASPWGPLPVYFFPARGSGKKPTVIISSGSDGQNVESMQFGVTQGLERGYNVALYEGPGQMSLLFKRGIPFTPEWDKVVAPVLSWVRKQPEVGKVALIGVSFGGMLCASAAAKVKGLSAVVLEPAAYSMPKMWTDSETVEVVSKTQGAPAPEKQKVQAEVNAGFLKRWSGMPRTQQFVLYKRGEIFSRQVQEEARAGKPISDYYALVEQMLKFDFEADYKQISIPTMLTANQGDEFFGDQPKQAFEFLTNVPASRKVLLNLTAAQGASLHDQPIGPQVAQEYIFDWLDDQLR